VQKKIH